MFKQCTEEFKGVSVSVPTQSHEDSFVEFLNHYERIMSAHTAFPCMGRSREREEYNGRVVFFIDEEKRRVFFVPEHEEENFRENGNFQGFEETTLETALKSVVEREFGIRYRKPRGGR